MLSLLLELPLLDLSGQAQQVFEHLPYLGPFLVLLLCGIGLPLPEEVTLIGSGILVHRGEAEFIPIIVVCSIAILLGDSIPFYLGRKYGKRLVRFPIIAKVLHPERFSRVEKRFLEHGTWATFVCRFLPGIRIPGYFIAGTLKMKYSRFILLDAVGVLISVPISIYLGQLFAENIDRLKETMVDLHLILGFLVLALAIIVIMLTRRNRAQNLARRKEERAARKQKEAAQGPIDPLDPLIPSKDPDSDKAE